MMVAAAAKDRSLERNTSSSDFPGLYFNRFFLPQASPASLWAHVNFQPHITACQSRQTILDEEQAYFVCFKLATCLFHLITSSSCIAGHSELLIPLHSQNCDTIFYRCLSYLLPSSPYMKLLQFCSVAFVIETRVGHCGQDTYTAWICTVPQWLFLCSVLFFLMISNVQFALFFFLTSTDHWANLHTQLSVTMPRSHSQIKSERIILCVRLEWSFLTCFTWFFKLCLILSPTHLVLQSPSAILQSVLTLTTRIVGVGQQHLCQPANEPGKEMTTNNQARKWWAQAGHQSLQGDMRKRDPITIKAGPKGDHLHTHINKGMPTGLHYR